jgi:hypothetical protein
MTVLPSSSRARVEELDGVPLLAFIPGADFGVPAVVLMEQSNTVSRYQRRIGLAGARVVPYCGTAARGGGLGGGGGGGDMPRPAPTEKLHGLSRGKAPWQGR